MADLGFGTEFGMQDGTGDLNYVRFMHGYMRTLSVCKLDPLSPSEMMFIREQNAKLD
jgi:hypothetical protein